MNRGDIPFSQRRRALHASRRVVGTDGLGTMLRLSSMSLMICTAAIALMSGATVNPALSILLIVPTVIGGFLAISVASLLEDLIRRVNEMAYRKCQQAQRQQQSLPPTAPLGREGGEDEEDDATAVASEIGSEALVGGWVRHHQHASCILLRVQGGLLVSDALVCIMGLVLLSTGYGPVARLIEDDSYPALFPAVLGLVAAVCLASAILFFLVANKLQRVHNLMDDVRHNLFPWAPRRGNSSSEAGRCPPRDRRWEDEEDEGMRRAVAATCRDGPGALDMEDGGGPVRWGEEAKGEAWRRQQQWPPQLERWWEEQAERRRREGTAVELTGRG